MKFYVYFDEYRRPIRAVNQEELIRDFKGDPDEFLAVMACGNRERGEGRLTGHVGTFSFESEEDLKDYLERCGEEISGFYECEDGSRPYNF